MGLNSVCLERWGDYNQGEGLCIVMGWELCTWKTEDGKWKVESEKRKEERGKRIYLGFSGMLSSNLLKEMIGCCGCCGWSAFSVFVCSCRCGWDEEGGEEK